MKHTFKKHGFWPLMLLALSLIIPHSIKNIYVAHAAPRPTNINVTDLTDSEINNYYQGVASKSGDELLGSLYDIIKGHEEYSYNSDTDRMIYKIIDRNWALSPLQPNELANFNYANDNPYIHKLYADYNDDKSTADRFKNEGAASVSFDKEHIWAQSLGGFGRSYGAGSDVHALWPADIKGNSPGHSNYNFGIPETSITNYNNDKGTYVGRNGYLTGITTNKVFEPLDQYKGDIARAMFYMTARYYQYVDTLHPKLTLVNGSPDAIIASPGNPGLAGNLATLLEWNYLDPVDYYEIHRNNLIYNNYQGNRNPFIDHPEWATMIYDSQYSGGGATLIDGSSSVGDNPVWENIAFSPLESISVDESNTITYFALNEPFIAPRLKVMAHYEDGSSRLINNYTTTPALESPLSNSGFQNVTVTYQEKDIIKTATYQIEVSTSSRVLLELLMDLDAVQTTFAFKEPFNTDGLILTAVYDDATEDVLLEEQYQISQIDTTILGWQTSAITFKDKRLTYDVFITNQGSNILGSKASDLIISEYIEGSSYNKALEIYNGTGTTIDLSPYSVNLYSNGSATISKSIILSGSLAHNNTYVMVHSKSNANYLSKSNLTSLAADDVINFNGDDAISLTKDDVIIDSFGQIGYDPGTAWTAGGVTTVDRTLVRKPSVKTGSLGYDQPFDPSIEWIAYGTDTLTYLGLHTMTFDYSQDVIDQSIAFASLFLLESQDFCESAGSEAINWSYLAEEYDYMIGDSKDYFTSNNITNETILEAKQRYKILVNKYAALAENSFMKNSLGEIDSGLLAYVQLNQEKVNLSALYAVGTLIIFSYSLGAVTYLLYRKRHRK